MKKHASIIREDILNDFSEIRGKTLMNHTANSYNIEMAIGFASLYCPEVIEVEGYIFIAEFYNGDIDELKRHYADRKEIEMFVNSWSLTSLLADCEKINYNINYIDEFAKAIQYYWQLRMRDLFPGRNLIVEIGENIMGEEGLSVTVYQK